MVIDYPKYGSVIVLRFYNDQSQQFKRKYD